MGGTLPRPNVSQESERDNECEFQEDSVKKRIHSFFSYVSP